ncbi:MAG: Crp/Fnr family transcriptional regulator [Bacteroidota bacterium]|nr:Crp/Fnr family transcriptional regulator [Bacteroidota bacterium]
MEKTICKFCNLKSAAAKKLNEDEICALGNNCAEVQFKTGDIIIKQDALSTNVVYVKSGLVKIHIKGPIKERIRKIIKAPAYLCLPSTFGDKVNHFSATALEDTSICFIDVNVFKQFIYDNGDFAYQIILDLSKGELQNFHSCLNNAQKQNIGRVADAILFFANEIYNSNSFTLPISRQDLADLTGITRESASRILTDFHNEKILEIDSRKITVVNEALLRQISEKG